MKTSLEDLAKRIAAAKCPEDLFGDLHGDLRHALAVEYRAHVHVVHPDKHTGVAATLASSCFTRLGELRDAAEAKIAAGTYGDRKPIDPPPPPRPRMDPQTIRAPKGEYVVEDLVAEGDLADIYLAMTGTPRAVKRRFVAFKIAQHPGDNDLLEHEAKVLGDMAKAEPSEAASPKKGRTFLPELLDTFVLRSASRSLRRVNVLALYDKHVSITDILRVYPRGIDFRDAAWIFKRMLYALWFIHFDRKVVHGAILPQHVLVHPAEHGAKLIDWCYAVPNDGKSHVRAISSPMRDFYPPEVLQKRAACPATDIYMAAKCAVVLLGGHADTTVMPSTVPAPIQGFLRSCLFAAASKRPDDAGALHEEFDLLLEKLVGKPTYRPLAMPAEKK